MTEATQIIVTLEPGPTALSRLAAVLAAMPVATVVVMPPAGGALDATTARPLVEAAQKADVAALIAGDAALARTLRADGVFLPWTPNALAAFEEAREVLGTRFIVGAGGGTLRHDAMSLAEAGAEFIAFGLDTPADSDGPDPDGATIRRFEAIDWWAEIFQVPCVALDVTTAEDARALAAAGADFLALPLPTAIAPSDVAAHVVALAAAAALGSQDRRVES